MAETKTQTIEREYVIPLRKALLRVPRYRRAGRAVKAIKQFVAKHMKVADRDVNNVKLDVYFNNEVWFRGRRHPPTKVKVRVIKEGDIVKVNFVDTPEHVTFLKAKHAKLHKAAEKKDAPSTATPSAGKTEEPKSEEVKREEKEKEKAVAEQGMKEAAKAAKVAKHITKVDKAQHPQRMALKK